VTHSVGRVLRGRHDLQVRLRIEQGLEPLAYEAIVVDDHEVDALCLSALRQMQIPV